MCWEWPYNENAMFLLFFLSTLGLVYTRALIRQIQYIAMVTKEGSTKIINFMIPRAGNLMLGRGYISHYSEYGLSSTLSVYGTLIAIVLRDHTSAFIRHY